MKSRFFTFCCMALLLTLIGGQPLQVSRATTPTVGSPQLEAPGPREWQAMSAQNRAEPQTPWVINSADAAKADLFGYAWSEAANTTQWIDLTAGATEVFTQTDDEFQGPFPLNFTFNFYENSYSEVYINTNGMLTFGEGRSDRDNVAIPQEALPNDFVAPLWTDLAVGASYGNPEGVVYYKTGSDAQGAYFAVEWYRVTGRYTVGQLTFEVILRENGKVIFLYSALSGLPNELTVGIEDGDGQDGLTYLFNNSAGLTAPKTITFTRPLPSSRSKLLPRLQGGFANNQQISFQLKVRNTGDNPAQPTDTFNLSSNTSAAGWSASLWSANGSALLPDTDGDGRADTGALSQGAEFTFMVKTAASNGDLMADAAAFTIEAQSKNSSLHTATALLQSAQASPFIQAYSGSLGLNAGFYNAQNLSVTNVDSWFGGSNMSLSPLNNGQYAFTWERNHDKVVGSQPILYSDAEYALLSPQGRVVYATSRLTDNQDVTLTTFDLSPMMTSATNTLGAIWIHQVFDPARGINANIYFQRLQTNGTPIDGSRVNVTHNPNWRAEGTLNVPVFFSPRILATWDNRFLLTWFDEQSPSLGNTVSNIWIAVFDTSGNVILPATQLTNSTANSILYSYPTVTLLENGHVFLAYTVFNDALETYTIAFTTLNSTGQVQQSEKLLTGSNGTRSDSIQIGMERILLAWTDTTQAQIGYAVLSGSDYSIISAPQLLTNPDPIPHPADFVSVTNGRDGKGVITWMDRRWSRHLYYALVDSNGTLGVEPMIFLTGADANVLVQTSFTGYGNAPRQNLIFLPLTFR